MARKILNTRKVRKTSKNFLIVTQNLYFFPFCVLGNLFFFFLGGFARTTLSGMFVLENLCQKA